MILNAERDFIENKNYLLSLVNTIKGKDVKSFDSNLVYEVAYADAYLSSIIATAESKTLCEELSGIRIIFENILTLIPDSDVLTARETFDYRKILSAKYSSKDSKEDGSYSKPYEVKETESFVTDYLKRRAVSIVLLGAFLFLMMSGNVSSLITAVLDFISDFSGVSSDVASSSNSPTDALMSVMSTLIGLMVMIVTLVFSFGLIIDLCYISIPMVREIPMFQKQYVSTEAKLSVEAIGNGQSVKFSQVKDYNRIDRNMYWLKSMLDTIDGMQDSGKLSSVYTSLAKLKAQLSLDTLHSKDYYMHIAKIEFLHDEYLKAIA